MRERIVGAATEQMSQGRVSVDRVATAAGVSRATVYRYLEEGWAA